MATCLFRDRQAVSQVIAALLLIAIAVSAAILLYVFSIGLLGTLQTGGGQQIRQQLMLEAYDWTNLGTLKVWVRNIGAAEIVLADIFVNGLAVNFVIMKALNGKITAHSIVLTSRYAAAMIAIPQRSALPNVA